MACELPVIPQHRELMFRNILWEHTNTVPADFFQKRGQVSSKKHQSDTEFMGPLIQKAVRCDTHAVKP